jgi:hypothetical protein
MKKRVNRRTVDLSRFPDLVVIYLGMRINAPRGVGTLLRFGRAISRAVAENPDGLLLHERIIYSLLPPHLGMRQYWRDFDCLEHWARTGAHRQWWEAYLRDTGGTGFWHETYFMRGGMEAIYDDMVVPVGFQHFAPVQPARGSMFSARRRLHLPGESPDATPVPEEALPSGDGPNPAAR